MSVALRAQLSANIVNIERAIAGARVAIMAAELEQYKIMIKMEMKKAKFTHIMAKLEKMDQEWIKMVQTKQDSKLIYIWENIVENLGLCEMQTRKHRIRMVLLIEQHKQIDKLQDHLGKLINKLQKYQDLAYDNVMQLDAEGVARLCGLDSVPNDALFQILQKLTPRSLLRLMQTSRDFCRKCRLFISNYRPDHPICEYRLNNDNILAYFTKFSPGRCDISMSNQTCHNYQTLPILATQMHVDLKFNDISKTIHMRSYAIACMLRDLYPKPRASLCTGLVYTNIDRFIDMALHDIQFVYTQSCTMHITLNIYNDIFIDLDRYMTNRKILDKLSRDQQLRKVNADRIIPFGQSNLHWRFTQQVRLNQTAFAMWVRRDIHITAPSIFVECPTKHRVQAGGFRFLQSHREFYTTIKPEYFAHWLRRSVREFSSTESGMDRGKTVFHIVWNGPQPRRVKK